jgi:hypothetical protein
MINLKEIKTGKATITIITALNFFVPGGLGIFLLKNDLFVTMDFTKLLFLSIILSAPFLLVSFMLAFFTSEVILTPATLKKESEEKQIPEDTEHNDLGLILLTNVFTVAIWGMVGASSWLSDFETDNMKIVNQIIIDYVSCVIIVLMLFIVYFIYKKYLKKLPWFNFRGKSIR